MNPARGAVVKGPDLFADHSYRPYVCLCDESHPFSDEEALCVAVTSTERSEAIRLGGAEFERGGLPRESYANPWTVVSIRHADIADTEGVLTEETTERIADAAADYLGAE
jgi:mRNA interferase MazF